MNVSTTDPFFHCRFAVRAGPAEGARSARTNNDIALVDVTNPSSPFLVSGMHAFTLPDNRRTFIPVPPDPNDPNAFVLPDDPNNMHICDVRVRLTSYRSNLLTNLSSLSGVLGATVSGGLQMESSSGNNLCAKKMNLTVGGSNTSPVKVRLSRKSE
jgi:hypothetical protein